MSQFSPSGDKLTLASFFKDLPNDIYPVGRLDYDSEGLLVLTNDKLLTARLLNPKFGHERSYWVQVEGIPDNAALEQLREGVWISVDGKKLCTKGAKAELIEAPQIGDRVPPIRYRKTVPDSWISLTLTEGKNRQVRKMTAAVGYPTLRLIRYRIGNVDLTDIPAGSWQEYDRSIITQLCPK